MEARISAAQLEQREALEKSLRVEKDLLDANALEALDQKYQAEFEQQERHRLKKLNS